MSEKDEVVGLFLRKMSLGWFLMARHADGSLSVVEYVTDPKLEVIK